MKLIDLHIHSTASDGSLTPTEVVNRANDLGLTAMALTDHDTVAGIDTGSQKHEGCSTGGQTKGRSDGK